MTESPQVTELRPYSADGNFSVGDYVTRDGSDVQLVKDLTEDGSCGTFVCVLPPTTGWCEAGEEEFNLCRRYSRIQFVQKMDHDPRLVQGTGVQKPVRLFAAFDDNRPGWCVWQSREGDVLAQFHAGPFGTREEAEVLLGPAAPMSKRGIE